MAIRRFAAAGLALLASCSVSTPAPSPPANSQQGSPPEASASIRAGPTNSASTGVGLAIQTIDQRFTTKALDYRSDGTGVIWSSSAADGPHVPYAADLWRYVPGDAEPARIFVNPNRDSTLDVIGGDGDGHFAFVERNARLLGDVGWQLWYLDEPNTSPRLLDTSDEASFAVPFFDIDAGRVVWGTVHQMPQGPRSQLLLAEPEADRPVVLQEGDPNQIGFAFPSLRDDSVAYSAFEALGRNSTTQEFRVYRLDLERHGALPERLDSTGDVAMPVLAGDEIVWKVSPDNAYGWGSTLAVTGRDGETLHLETAAMHTDSQLAFNYPSVGDGYLAAFDTNHDSLYIFDLVAREPLLIEDLGEGRVEGERDSVLVRPHVAGRLLAYVQGSDDLARPLLLKYVELPPAGGS